MRFTTKTEYGLICLVNMANHYPKKLVMSIKEISQEEQYSLSYLEKIFQSLRSADVVNAHHGKQGGYSLARHPAQITLKQIIEALEGSTFDIYCEPDAQKNIVCTHLCLCGMKPVWKTTRRILDNFYGSITLEMIATQQTITADLMPHEVNITLDTEVKR